MRCCNFRALHIMYQPSERIETVGIPPSRTGQLSGVAFLLPVAIHLGNAAFEVWEGKECT